ncbi:hypothetical protein [Luteimonas sp. MC1825]|uniref:hypothetical protein n=1 Tax=Luteimonas sp. MC1825 TaxID=2761107 RepID=UPI001619F48C|nr:hypothetical protein [Luteimonas sp. MC1825]MBB6600650.1 hypothetical protein [Luteimonas sp. MC1825]QOC88248.1 hypothetical protein IDM46_00240 [Luteimonas sp. MC1825]
MFGIFSRTKAKPPSGSEMSENGLRLVADAIAKNAIQLEQGRIYPDIYVHADEPDGGLRITYLMFSSSVQNQLIARSAFCLSRAQQGIPIWQIDCAVLAQYRGEGFGTAIATKSLAEFVGGMSKHSENGFVVEAVVDDEKNEAALQIARNLIGGEEVLFDKSKGVNVHSFIRKFAA